MKLKTGDIIVDGCGNRRKIIFVGGDLMVPSLVDNFDKAGENYTIRELLAKGCTKEEPKPELMELWVNTYPSGNECHNTEDGAERNAAPGRLRCVHMKEVVE